MERIKKRGRGGETNITLDYLRILNREFRAHYLNNRHYKKVFVINAEECLEKVVEQVEEIIRSLDK